MIEKSIRDEHPCAMRRTNTKIIHKIITVQEQCDQRDRALQKAHRAKPVTKVLNHVSHRVGGCVDRESDRLVECAADCVPDRFGVSQELKGLDRTLTC